MFSSRKLPAYHPRKSSYHPDQLLLRLSIYGFSKLSVRDQRLHTEEILTKVVENVAVEQLSEETDEGFRIRTFTELLKKLPSAYKQICITMFIKKFMHERQFGELISTFKHLEANDQQKAIEIIVEVAPEKNLQIPGEADEDFRLRRFTQLCRDHTVTSRFRECHCGRHWLSSCMDMRGCAPRSRSVGAYVQSLWSSGRPTRLSLGSLSLVEDLTLKRGLGHPYTNWSGSGADPLTSPRQGETSRCLG
ncbi:hypothetical protein ACLB2K_001168 [Fragaria x ananassa]